MSRVYIPQEPLKRDRITGEVVPKFDLSDVKTFGEIKCLLSWGEAQRVMAPAPLSRFLERELADYSDDDYILPVGNPSVYAIVASEVTLLNKGRFRILWWDKETRDYKVVTIDHGDLYERIIEAEIKARGYVKIQQPSGDDRDGAR